MLKKILTGICLAALLLPSVTAAAAEEVCGTNDTLLSAMSGNGSCVGETPLGLVTADALRSCGGTDIGLVNGGCFNANLQGGDFTMEDLRLIFPEEEEAASAEITPAELYALLEQGTENFTLDENERVDYGASASDDFLQVSGFTYRFDVSAPAGERISRVTLPDETELSRADTETVLTVTAPEPLLEAAGIECTPLGMTLPEVLAEYAQAEGGTLYYPDTQRIRMIGTTDSSFMNGMAPSALLFIVCIAVVYGVYQATLGTSAAWKALQDRVKPETEEEKKSPLNRLFKK